MGDACYSLLGVDACRCVMCCSLKAELVTLLGNSARNVKVDLWGKIVRGKQQIDTKHDHHESHTQGEPCTVIGSASHLLLLG